MPAETRGFYPGGTGPCHGIFLQQIVNADVRRVVATNQTVKGNAGHRIRRARQQIEEATRRVAREEHVIQAVSDSISDIAQRSKTLHAEARVGASVWVLATPTLHSPSLYPCGVDSFVLWRGG